MEQGESLFPSFLFTQAVSAVGPLTPKHTAQCEPPFPCCEPSLHTSGGGRPVGPHAVRNSKPQHMKPSPPAHLTHAGHHYHQNQDNHSNSVNHRNNQDSQINSTAKAKTTKTTKPCQLTHPNPALVGCSPRACGTGGPACGTAPLGRAPLGKPVGSVELKALWGQWTSGAIPRVCMSMLGELEYEHVGGARI